MEDSTRTEALLVEIRDLLKELLADSAEQAARGVALAEESVERQRRFTRLYKWVLVVGALIIAGIIYFVLLPVLAGRG